MIQDVKKIYLCTPDLKIRTVLNGLQTDSADLHQYVKDYDELTFSVDRFLSIDGKLVESNGYEDLKVYMYLLVDGIGYFQIQEPTVHNDGNYEYKEIQAYSLEKEFEQKDWVGLKINCGKEDSLEMLAPDNIDDLGFAKEHVVLYYPEKPELSFIDLMLTKLPYWSVGHVDESLTGYKENLKIPLMEIDNSNIYAIMTNTVAPRMGFIFIFDYLNRTVNAYAKDNLDFDTNIFIGYRNLANNVDITVDEDSVFTRFRVRGDNDLMITNANYGEERCFDLSYFLGEPYMEQELADKIKQWIHNRDSYREHFVADEKQAAELNRQIDELQYHVPSDNTYWKQWDNMSYEGLEQNLGLSEAQLAAIQTSVDDRPDSEKYDENRRYIPKKKDGSEEVDHDWYLKKLDTTNTGGLYTYIELVTYVIPYIKQAMINVNVPSDQKIRFGTESEENWELYGLYELDGKLKSYEEDKLPALNHFSKDWKTQMTEQEKLNYVTEEGYNIQGRNDYVHIQEMIRQMKERKALLEQRIAELQAVLTEVEDSIRDANIANNLDTCELFTEDEKNYIRTLFIDTDYTNSNILSTSLDNAETLVDRSYELYKDATDKLSEVARPQYQFSVSLDNLLRIPEFADWTEDLRLMRFIRLGIRDDFSVKLRIIEMEYNPCEVDETLTLVFSSMITSKSGRNDLTQIIDDENNRGSKNSISLGTGASKSDEEYASTLLTWMVKSGIFTNAVRNTAAQVVGATDTSAVNNLIQQYMGNTNVHVDHLSGTQAEFDTLFSGKLSSDAITTILLNAEQGNFNQVVTKYLESDAIVAGLINADQGDFNQVSAKIINAGSATIDNIVSTSISAADIDVGQIKGDYAEFAELISPYIEAGQVTADSVITAMLNATEANVERLNADNAFINYLNSKLVVASEIKVDDLKAKLATIDVAEITQLYSSQAFVENVQAVSNTAIQAKVTDAYIQNAIIGKIAVADLMTGDITISDSMRILSDNGKLIMNGSALQILGTDSYGNDYIGVQLGYATNGQPSLILRNEAGATIIDPTGITADAVADGLIVNNMIHNGTISEDKLSFNVMKQGDTISIEKITTGGGSFGVEYTEFKNGTRDALDELKQDISSKSNYQLYIETPNGTNIRGGNIVLNAKLLKDNIEVTDEWDTKYFHWERKSNDTYGDSNWKNSLISKYPNGTKTITVTANDVSIDANFVCYFEFDNVAVSSS